MPAKSVNLAVIVYEPFANVAVVQVKVPEVCPLVVTHADPLASPPMRSCALVSFGALAVNDGVAVGETKSPSHQVGRHVREPMMVESMIGPVVSMTIVKELEVADEFPAVSVATAVAERDPSAPGIAVHENTPVPCAATQVEPDGVPSIDSWTVAPASVVPVTVGVVSFVMPSVLEIPVSDDAAKVKPLGVDGAVVSIVTDSADDGADVWAPTVAVAVIDLVPAVNVPVVQEKAPPDSVHADPVAVPSA